MRILLKICAKYGIQGDITLKHPERYIHKWTYTNECI